MSDRSDVNSIGCSFYTRCLVFVDTLNVFLGFLSRFTLDLSAEGCWHLESNIHFTMIVTKEELTRETVATVYAI